MEWQFSIGASLLGLLIMAIGVGFVVFHQKLADSFFGGVSNYGKTQLAGIIIIILGFILLTNLHTLIIYWLVSLIAPKPLGK
jgi:uncharacterized membrane-anchored protein YitT (DUF2179 family)